MGEPECARPDAPYVTIFLSGLQAVGSDGIGETYFDDPDYVAVPFGNRNFTLAVQGFKTGAMQEIQNIADALQVESGRAALQADGIAYVRALDVEDISQILDSQMEERAMVDIQFRIGVPYGVAATEDTGAILKLTEESGEEATGTISGNSDPDNPIEIILEVDAT